MTDPHGTQTRKRNMTKGTDNGLKINKNNGGDCVAAEMEMEGIRKISMNETTATEKTTEIMKDKAREGEERHGVSNGRKGKESRNEDDTERARDPNTHTTGDKYRKELTVEVEVEGGEKITMLDVLKEVKKQCGEVVGCRVRGEKTFEITMNDLKGKEKLMDGVRVGDALIHAKEITNDDMVVSFINLPVYLEDSVIQARLVEWGVKPVSPIKRRKWPGTDIADGTRFLKVRFNDQVRSLPYSTKLETVKGMEYFRVIHDKQVRVCRLCIKPGHIFRECPEFRCFRCHETGHYARECVAHKDAEREKDEEKRTDDGETQGEERTEEKRPESGSEMEERDDGESEDGNEEQQEQDEEQDGDESAMEEEVEVRRKESETEKEKEKQQKEEEKRREDDKKNGRKSKETMGGGGKKSSNEETMRGDKGQTEFEYQDITDSDENKWEEIAATRKRPLGRKERPEKAKKKMQNDNKTNCNSNNTNNIKHGKNNII